MTTSEEAGRAEIIRQIQHFTKLGKDKPEDHEYNLTARGLKELLVKDSEDEDVRTLQFWTCANYTATEALRDREHGSKVSYAAKHCPCLKDGCEARLVEITFTERELEIIDSDEVMKRIKDGK